jgi:hypothetical protein
VKIKKLLTVTTIHRYNDDYAAPKRSCGIVPLLLALLTFPLAASGLVMSTNGPEPVIVEIKESLRTSDYLDNRLAELAAF